jgi:hypothetical protein
MAAQPYRSSTMSVQPDSYSTLFWRTSRASAGAGECVEVASASSSVLTRDSRDRSGAVLEFTPAQWLALVERIKNGYSGLGPARRA